MRRFYVEKVKEKDGRFVIQGSEARHISKVLRMRRGDRIILMDGEGARFEAVIDSLERGEVCVVITKSLPGPSASPVEITLCQSMLRSGPMDYLVEKTSELGVYRIIPFSSERTVVRLEGDRAEKRRRRWQEIARSAAKQSGRKKPAGISSTVSFHDLMDTQRQEEGMKIILWEEEEVKDLKHLLRSLKPAETFLGVIGPEGGFSKKEIGIAREAGFMTASLGNRTLRAETAAITLVAIVQYEWGDLGVYPNIAKNLAQKR